MILSYIYNILDYNFIIVNIRKIVFIMAITDLTGLARASRLECSPAEIIDINAKLNSVINWIDEIQAVDTNGIESMINPLYSDNQIYNEDVAQNGIEKECAMSNSKVNNGMYFLVPKVIE